VVQGAGPEFKPWYHKEKKGICLACLLGGGGEGCHCKKSMTRLIIKFPFWPKVDAQDCNCLQSYLKIKVSTKIWKLDHLLRINPT
jgi:hypothetical protein